MPYYPPAWSSDSSMGFYFAPLRVGQNDENLSKIEFWRDFIEQSQKELIENQGKLSFTIAELMLRFTRGGDRPDCLSEIVDSLLQQRVLCESPKLPSQPSQAQSKLIWKAAGLAVSIGKYALGFLSPPRVRPSSSSPSLCLTRHLAESSQAALQLLQNHEILPLNSIYSILSRYPPSDAEAILAELVRVGSAVELSPPADESVGGLRVFKFSSEPPTLVDFAIGQLKSAIAKCDHAVSTLEQRIAAELSKARALVKARNLEAAKRRLNMKAKLSSAADSMHAKQTNLEHLLISLEQSKSQSAVVAAMKSANSALKEANKSGASEEEIDQLMSEIGARMEESAEIDRSLSQPVTGVDALSEEELEAEYQKLVQQFDSETQAKQEIKDKEKEENIDQLTQNVQQMSVKATGAGEEMGENEKKPQRQAAAAQLNV